MMAKEHIQGKLNEYQPVVRTAIARKCLEKLRPLNNIILESIDLLQFTYHPNRSVENVVTIALHLPFEHLDKRNTYV